MAAPLITILGPETIRKTHDPEYYSSSVFQNINDPPKTIKWLNDIGPQNAKSLKMFRVWVDAPYIPEVKRLPDSAYDPALLKIINIGDEIWKPTGPEWCKLFDTISKKATGLRELEVWWNCASDCGHFGGGFDVKLVRAIGKIQGLEKLKLSGCYAKEWSGYLREKTGAEVMEKKDVDTLKDWELKHFRKHQGAHRELKP